MFTQKKYNKFIISLLVICIIFSNLSFVMAEESKEHISTDIKILNTNIYMIDIETLDKTDVAATAKKLLEQNKSIVFVGNSFKRSDVLKKLGFKGFSVISSDGSTFMSSEDYAKLLEIEQKDLAHINNVDELTDTQIAAYREKRLKQSLELNKKTKNINNSKKEEMSCDLLTVTLINVNGNIIPYTSIVTGGLTKEEKAQEINNYSLNFNKTDIQQLAVSTLAADDTLIDDWSINKYCKFGTETLFYWKSVGKVYKESDSNSTYDYYYLKTFDEFTSGDYLYNNGYELNDLVIADSFNNASGGQVMVFGPTDYTNVDEFDVGVNLITGEVSVGFKVSSGANVDIMTADDNDAVSWGFFPHGATSWWLPSKFFAETVMEMKVYQTDTSFQFGSFISAGMERYLGLEGYYDDNNIVQISR